MRNDSSTRFMHCEKVYTCQHGTFDWADFVSDPDDDKAQTHKEQHEVCSCHSCFSYTIREVSFNTPALFRKM